MLIVDSREDPKIFKMLKRMKVSFEQTNLLVGDYFENEKNLVVERKTIEDFLGSYISGHIQEQFTNTENNFDECYLFISGRFENLFFNKRLPTQIKHLTSESFNKMKIHLYRSFPKLKIVEFPNDTQLIKGVLELFTYKGSQRTTRIVKMHSSKEDIYLSQICCVPGIGLEKAKRILAEVKTPYKLYELDITALKEIKGIGEVQATKIKEYFNKGE